MTDIDYDKLHEENTAKMVAETEERLKNFGLEQWIKFKKSNYSNGLTELPLPKRGYFDEPVARVIAPFFKGFMSSPCCLIVNKNRNLVPITAKSKAFTGSLNDVKNVLSGIKNDMYLYDVIYSYGYWTDIIIDNEFNYAIPSDPYFVHPWWKIRFGCEESELIRIN